MPAVTVPDTSVLPRISAPGLAAVSRPVVQRTEAPSGFEGEGFPVRRAFAGVDLARLDPFIHMDQMGEVEYAPGEPKGTPWHPHRGFETVTYIMDGVFDHQDSQGGGGTITNGDTQWMTAGSGLLHIEAPPEWLVTQGGLFHGIQLWVNLPRSQKLVTPRYQDIRAGSVGLATTPDGGALVRVIAGDVAGLRGSRLDAYADGPRARDPRPDGVPRPAVAHGLQCAGLRAVRPGDRRTRPHAGGAGQPRGARRRRRGQRERRPRARRAGSTVSTCWCSAGGRSASRSPGPVRSS